jgi:hypothetical protein
MAAVAASTLRTDVVRISTGGAIEQRTLEKNAADWTPWRSAGFGGRAIALSALSGSPGQVEIFALDDVGGVWNRWWRSEPGWLPAGGFNPLGRPFTHGAVDIAAFSAGAGYFACFVEHRDGQMALLPHQPGRDGVATWRRCMRPDALGDGWWPAFVNDSAATYRSHATKES